MIRRICRDGFFAEGERKLPGAEIAISQPKASPVPSGRRKCANMRTIFGTSTDNAKGADWVADGAVWIEPFSLANSLINRETTGNFLKFQA